MMLALPPQPVAFAQRIALLLALKFCTWYSSPQGLASVRPELPPPTPPPTRTLPSLPTPTTSLEQARPFPSLNLFLGPLVFSTAVTFAAVAAGIFIGAFLHFSQTVFHRLFTNRAQDVLPESGLLLGPSGNEPTDESPVLHDDPVPLRTLHFDPTSSSEIHPSNVPTTISDLPSLLDAESSPTSEFAEDNPPNFASRSVIPIDDPLSRGITSQLPASSDAESMYTSVATGIHIESNVMGTTSTPNTVPSINSEIVTHNIWDASTQHAVHVPANDITERPLTILADSEGIADEFLHVSDAKPGSAPGITPLNVQDNAAEPGSGFIAHPTSESDTLTDIAESTSTFPPAVPRSTSESIQSESPSNPDEVLIAESAADSSEFNDIQSDELTEGIYDDPPIPELPPLVPVRVGPPRKLFTTPEFPLDDHNYNPLADRRIPAWYCSLVLQYLAVQYEVFIEKEWFKVNSEMWDQEAADYQTKIRRLEIELATIRRDNDGLRREVAPPDYNRAIMEGAFDEWSAAVVSGAAAFVPPRRSDYTQDQPGSIPSRPTDQPQSTNTTEGTIDATVVTNPAPSAPIQSLDGLGAFILEWQPPPRHASRLKLEGEVVYKNHKSMFPNWTELFLVRRFKKHSQVLSATSPAIMDIECYFAIMAYIICLLRLCYYPLPPTPRNTPGSPIAELPWAFNNRTREWYLPDPPKIIRFNNSADLIIPVLELLKDPVAAEIFFPKLRTNTASQPSAHPAAASAIEEENNTASIHSVNGLLGW
ncbi:hypothetical protein C0995_004434 [Termitomyces sp. Mi166|nr:hypothetical protein C0995_004434 [Termitomyces sp. Mi166\